MNQKTKLVVLDGYALNPGDLNWEGLEALGEVTVYDRTRPEDTVSRIGDAEVIFTNKTVLTAEIMDACPSVKYIGVLATGYNVVDIAAAKERNIIVTNIPEYGTEAVAQFTFSLILEICSRVGVHDRSVKDGDWIRSKDFMYTVQPLTELRGKTLGIIGFGHIGQKVAEIALAFGMKVLVSSRSKKEVPLNVQFVTREEVFANADILSLHCPLFPDTERMINAENINKMKNGAILINTARGGCVAEEDLKDALNSGKLAGAAVDVVASEPMKADCPLLDAKNIIITPHIAWASKEARQRLMNTAVDNAAAFLKGAPINVIP